MVRLPSTVSGPTNTTPLLPMSPVCGTKVDYFQNVAISSQYEIIMVVVSL